MIRQPNESHQERLALMDGTLSTVLGFWWVIPIILCIVGFKLILRVFGIIMIPEDSVGIVNKKFVLFGEHKALPDGAIIALRGEAGIQADTLPPGLHFWLWPWQYEITQKKFITVAEGYVGVVEARDGKAMTDGRVLAKQVQCDSFQNARMFIETGGQRGPQIAIMTPGTYRVNTGLFNIEFEKATEIKDNMVGIVTTKDGAALKTGQIAGAKAIGHSSYQDGEAFITAGGYKGLQEHVILAGRYYINPRFATVEECPMTEIPIAHVGVVISFVGEDTDDLSGNEFEHGNLFKEGSRGVWESAKDPGKYPINKYTHRIELVPTANVVLNWATGKTESHKLDANLSTIKVRSSDGFTFTLDVSQIICIPSKNAPKVIARFGTVANMVTQVLEPIISNYFRNAAQGADVIQFLAQRSNRQEEAREAIAKALTEYNVKAVDTLIGDIVPPDALMKTLTDRKIADQERETYRTQQSAEEARKLLQQAKATADTQASVVKAERDVEIAEFNAQSTVKKAEGSAKAKTIEAEADAQVMLVTGEAEGKKTMAIGTADAKVIEMKTTAMGQGNYAAVEVARALAGAHVPIVPQITVAGNGQNGGTLVDVLMANSVQEALRKNASSILPQPEAPTLEAASTDLTSQP